MAEQYYEGIGRTERKHSPSQNYKRRGLILLSITKNLKNYFTRMGDADSILEPFGSTGENQTQYDITVKVEGGGVTGQTDAVQLGLARAFVKLNPDYISNLRKDGLLTRDPRVKERKKPGLKRARKAPTYTKR